MPINVMVFDKFWIWKGERSRFRVKGKCSVWGVKESESSTLIKITVNINNLLALPTDRRTNRQITLKLPRNYKQGQSIN